MATPSTRGTGDEPTEALDPGGTRSTKPGNPDKSGPSKPMEVRKEKTVTTGDQNAKPNV